MTLRTTESSMPPQRSDSELTPEWELFLLRQDLQATRTLLGMAYEENDKLRKQNIHLEELAYTDALTGLRNLHYWNRWSADVWNDTPVHFVSNDNDRRRKGDLVLAFIDVNGLGRINKEYGDHVGDALIKNTAFALAASFKRASDMKHFDKLPDHIIARKGGDELVMLLPQTSVEFLTEAMEDINRLPVVQCGKLQIKIRCSYGLVAKHGDKTFNEALQEADEKMQSYKKTAPKSAVIETNTPKIA